MCHTSLTPIILRPAISSACLVAAIAGCFHSIAAAAPGSGFGKVELVRDRWGVPHVFAETDAGAMYGLGYATAEDRAFQMHYTLRVIQGRLAEVIGPVRKVRRDETAVQNDRKMRTFGFARAAELRVGELDEESRSLLQAYARGVNDYFRSHRDELCDMFERVGLTPEPWTPADCLLSWWHLAQFFATDGTRDLMQYRNLTQGAGRNREMALRQARIQAGRGAIPMESIRRVPQDDSAAVVGRDDVSDQWIARTREFLTGHGYKLNRDGLIEGRASGPKFSHAWVVDGTFSGTGGAVLVSMPQTPVANPSLLYEFHVCGKTFNARGIGVAGSPIILIGWNEQVAWGLTALGADQADLFRLKTDRDHPDQYQLDGKWHAMRTVKEVIKVKGGQAETLEVRETSFGPVVNEFAFSRPGDPPVALKRIPMCDRNHDTWQGALAMMRAGNVREFLAALEQWRFPTGNAVFGDSAGNIGYSTVGALPLRSPLALDNGRAAHDGSDAKYDWQAIIPQDLVPHVINPSERYLFSGNHRPIGAFYPIPIGIQTGAMGDSLRSWRLRQLLSARKSMTAHEVLDMFRDSTNPARRAIVRIGYQLRNVLKKELPFQVQLALEHLESWYAKGSPARLDVPGAELAAEINTQFRLVNSDLAIMYGGGESGLSHFLKTVNKRLDEDPKAQITSLEQQYVEDLLTSAWENAERAYGLDVSKWNEKAREQVTRRKLAYYGSLDGFPSLAPERDMNLPALSCVDGQTVFSQAAQAYVQWVPMARVNDARSLLPPGPAESTRSPYRTVNVQDWEHGELHPAPLSRSAVEKIAASQQTLVPAQ